MQKVILGNAKIKEILNFGKLKNSENVLYYQKSLMFSMNCTDIGKLCFAKLFILDHGTSTWIQSHLLGFFCKVLFRPNTSLSSQISYLSLSAFSKIPHKICFVFS